jgi:hypothetical protein
VSGDVNDVTGMVVSAGDGTVGAMLLSLVVEVAESVEDSDVEDSDVEDSDVDVDASLVMLNDEEAVDVAGGVVEEVSVAERLLKKMLMRLDAPHTSDEAPPQR